MYIRRVRTLLLSPEEPASQHPPFPLPPPLFEGSMVRGGPNLPFAAGTRQQQDGDQRSAPPPPTSRGDGQHGGPPSAPPSASRVRGERISLTATQQQQRTPALNPTDVARQTYSLYRQCVAAGQWASFRVENLPDGQHISFFCRPLVAAPAAARAEKGKQPARRRRRPNQKRTQQKKLWVQSRVQQRQQGNPCSQLTPARAATVGLQQQQQQADAAATAVTGSYARIAAAAASPKQLGVPVAPAATAAVAANSGCSPVISPRMTRSKKRRKELSPGDFDAVCQLDGADASTPMSSPEPTTPAASPRLAAFPELHVPPETPGEIETTATSEKEAVPPQKEVVKSSLTMNLDALHRKAHAGLIVEGCDRCSRKK